MPLGKTSNDRLDTCHPRLQQLIRRVMQGVDEGDLEYAGITDITVLCGFRGEADSEADKALLVAALQDCEAECAKVGAFEGKIFPGDGSFLKMLVQLFLKFAPLILVPIRNGEPIGGPDEFRRRRPRG